MVKPVHELPMPEDDGLEIPTVGPWSRDKHHFLRRYIDAFTTSMKGKRWQGLHYIDLFAGGGIERLKGSDQLDWGSPLIAAQARYPFTQLHLCELKASRCDALQQRLQRFELRLSPQVLCGDANQRVTQIVASIPDRSLSLAFLDPYGLHLYFETLKVLASKRIDLIIFFPDHLDALRNLKYVYEDDPSSNLDLVLGLDIDWRARLEKTPKDRWAEILRRFYCRQIRKLGYREFEFERICAKGHPLYLLIFCSRHTLAAKLWRGVSSSKLDGQRTLDFGSPQ